MAARRAERVGRQVVQALASIVERGASDPRLRGVTFTDARMTDDLRNVRVLFSVLGSDESLADVEVGLRAASGFLRRELARGLALRYVPNLTFEHDESLRRAGRIEDLLRRGDDHGA